MSASLVCVNHSAQLGGAELYLLDFVTRYPGPVRVLLFEEGPFAERLRDVEVPVVVIGGGEGVTGVRKQGSWHAALRGGMAMVRLMPALRRAVADADVVLVNSLKAVVAAAPVMLTTSQPVLWALHDLITPDHFSPANRRAIITCSNHSVDRVLANSIASLEAYRAAGGRVEGAVIPNGIDADRFIAARPVRNLRSELGVGGAPLIGCFGRLTEWKGQHVLLEALAGLAEGHALIVGDALFEGDAEYGAFLRRRTEELGLTDRVHFLGFRDDVERLMKSADLVVHTSVAPEPFGRVLVEGMMSGRPVVGTDAGGAAEIVTSGETGLLTPPGDVEALRAAVQFLLEHPPEARRMAGAGQREASARYPASIVAEQITRQIFSCAPVAQAERGDVLSLSRAKTQL